MDSAIAITGIGVVCALGVSHREIIANIRAGKTGIRKQQFSSNVQCPFGAVPMDGPEFTDRAPVLAEAAVADCFRHAGTGIAGNAGDRTAVIVSSSKGLLRNLLRLLDDADDRELWDKWQADRLGLGIARRYGISGPVLNYPAACASGTVSMIAATHLLREGVVDYALTGSAEAAGNPLLLAAFQNMGALTPDVCRPFDRRRCGFNPGEGAAVFLLERAADARARGQRICALINGWDFRSDAHHMTGIEPSGATLEYSIRQTLERAGWMPQDVEYINAHGSGTPINDAVEAAVIGRVFGSECPYVSSLKPAIGHVLGASSSVELALSLLCAMDGYLPATLNVEDPEFQINLISRDGVPAQVRRILKTSLGFGGHIGSLALRLP